MLINCGRDSLQAVLKDTDAAYRVKNYGGMERK